MYLSHYCVPYDMLRYIHVHARLRRMAQVVNSCDACYTLLSTSVEFSHQNSSVAEEQHQVLSVFANHKVQRLCCQCGACACVDMHKALLHACKHALSIITVRHNYNIVCCKFMA